LFNPRLGLPGIAVIYINIHIHRLYMDDRLIFIFDIQPGHTRTAFDESAMQVSAHTQYKMVGWNFRRIICHLHTFNIVIRNAVIERCQSEFIRFKRDVAVVDTCHRQKTEYTDNHHHPDDSHDDMCSVMGDCIQFQIDEHAQKQDTGEKSTQQPYAQYRVQEKMYQQSRHIDGEHYIEENTLQPADIQILHLQVIIIRKPPVVKTEILTLF